MNMDCRICRSTFVRRVGRWYGRPFVECAECGFIFSQTAGREAGPGEASGGGAPTETDFLEPAFERLGPGRPFYLLAFGCRQSALPERLRQDGHRVIGVDRAAPRRPHRDCLTGDLLEMNLVPGQFDLVYADRALEYLPEPRPVLEELLQLTRTGGLVAIRTDLNGPFGLPGSSGEAEPSALPVGCSYFRQRTFEKMLEGRADTLVDIRPHMVLIEVGTRVRTGRSPRRAMRLAHDEAIERQEAAQS